MTAFSPVSRLGRSLLTMALLQVLSAGQAWAGAEKPLTELERHELEQSTLACQSQDYKNLFQAMIRSTAVQKKYTASQIDYEESDGKGGGKKRRISKDSYDKFPIQMFDFYWKTTVPAKAGDKDEYVMMEFNQSQSNQISVEWTRVHFRGQSAGGDDLGKPFDLDGKPYLPGSRADGQLLLYPTKDCWELVSDIRYVTP